MNIEEAKKNFLEPQKISLEENIRKFKREGIENFIITRPEIVETLLTAYEKEKEKNKELEKIIQILEAKPYTAYTLYGDILHESDEIAQMLKEVLEKE